MSETVDTSAEAVERLAGYLTGHHIYGGSVVIADAAATLRALLAERDAARTALKDMLHAVCGETGFAAAVRAHSETAYPWEPLDIAEEKARAALAKEPGHET